MEDYGVDVLVLEVYKAKRGNDVTAYGTKRAEEFLDAHEDLEWEFSCFMNGKGL